MLFSSPPAQFWRPLLLTSVCLHACPLPPCRRWFFVAGEKEVITKQVASIASKAGLDL
jgi:hypothetical protein